MTPVKGNTILEIITMENTHAEHVATRIPGFVYAKGNTLQGEPSQGIVYLIDPNIKDAEYKVGDRVVFHSKEIFQGFEHDGKKLISVKHHEIIAKVNL